jgi:hypothetical protein
MTVIACTIHIDAGVNSNLDFEKEKRVARGLFEQGLNFAFKIDLGLFSHLKKPLSHKSQYLSLDLALEHFRDTFWGDFQESIDDISLYSGHVDFSKDFIFDEIQILNLQNWLKEHFSTPELFSKETAMSISTFSEITPEILSKCNYGKKLVSFFTRDACLEYIHILAANLPDTMPISIHLDASGIIDPLFFALLTSKEHFHSLKLHTTNGVNYITQEKEANIAICLPSLKSFFPSTLNVLKYAFDLFEERKIPYRVIPEALLISEWDLVDYLFVNPATLNKEGIRKLQGFAAAGGIVVSLAEPIGIPGEILFTEYLQLKS